MSDLYTLLIGINCYLPNKLSNGLFYNSLWGCVQDILRIEDFLRRRLQVPDDRIIKLTASRGETAEPPEPRSQWPTYENIVNAFKELAKRAQPGDQVYIHYSGHGGRTPTTEKFFHLKGRDGIDEVLVPMDLGNSEGRYLRDTEVQYLLKTLVDRELLVTVVLDSCHAGGATRGVRPLVDPSFNLVGVRGISEIDTTPRPADSLVASAEDLARTWEESTNSATRAVESGGGWLLEPRGYVLLAACRANEYANEVVFEGNEKNGALTYWLVDTLQQMGPDFTYKMLHDRILAKVHSQFSEQTPQLQGEGNRVVFGASELPSQNAVTVISVNPEEGLLLNAGRTHGVGLGSRFNVYPLHQTYFGRADQRLALVEVTKLGAISSTAKVISEFGARRIEAGCQAILLDTGEAQLQRRVRLVSEDGETAADHVDALNSAARAIKSRPDGFVQLAGDKDPSDYIVTVNHTREYVICDAGGRPVPNLRPPLRISDSDAAIGLSQRLVHLAKFTNIRILDNGGQSALARKLLVELAGVQTSYVPGDQPAPQPFTTAGHIHSLNHGEWTFLHIRNNFSEALNVTVLDLQPDWGISQIYPSRSGAFEVVDPGGELLLPLRVTLPEGYQAGTDIIKVFATLKTTSFRWLELPALDQAGSADNLRGIPATSLEKFLSAFSAPEATTRQVEIPTSTAAEWVTHQVEIEITR
jgi:hypothetical protein